MQQESAKSQMQQNLYQTHVRRFRTVMNDYNTTSHQFKQNLQDRTRRQLKIGTFTNTALFCCVNAFQSRPVQAFCARNMTFHRLVDSSITEEDVEKIVESGEAAGVIKQALISDNVKDVVQDIEERHKDIMKLEKQVKRFVLQKHKHKFVMFTNRTHILFLGAGGFRTL